MKFTKIRVVGLKTVDFPIVDLTSSSPYILKSVSGLGPPESDVVITNALRQSGVYQNSLAHMREVVMRIGLGQNFSGGQTAADLRTSLYWMLEHSASKGNKIQIMNGDTVICETNGYVKHFETVPWSNTPEVQITMPCDDVYLVSPTTLTHTSATNQITLTAQGTARAPIVMEIKVVAATTHVGIDRYFDTRVTPNSEEYVAIAYYQFQANDILRIDTTPGSRTAVLTRGGSTSNVMGYLAPGSKWPVLDPGVSNRVRAFGLGGESQTVLQKLYYKPRYWGI